ncbi:P-loop containing nucleoside triphosphate hydrolase protein [Lojkania enalia]|uniref:RNA helicase n=1 Tax=Lojkania enalia TaxID=147567 RepID=A0A9P4KE98_9PLEO|nr:P-loop containing nucleoside triphosphate hydrolase protein [Didymosphaeria enalia]
MAARTDSSRFDNRRGRYEPPHRRDRRYDRRDDHYDDRRGTRDDHYDDRRGTRDDHYDDRRGIRDDRSSRNSYGPSRRRSRSPPPDRRPGRDRSRDRYRDRERDRYVDDRYRDDRGRLNRDRDREYGRDRDLRRRDASRESFRSDRRQRSRSFSSAVPDVEPRRGSYDAGSRRGSYDRMDDRHVSREEWQRREQENAQRDKEAEKQAKLAKLEEWKKKQAEKKSMKQVQSPAAVSSPIVTAPTSPAAISSPVQKPAQDSTQIKTQKTIAKKSKPKSTFMLDQNATSRPFQPKLAGKSTSSTSTTSVAQRVVAPQSQSKTNGNISSFGLKPKSADDDTATTKSTLLDDEDGTKKRTLQALPDITPTDEPLPEADDVAMSDIGSDDEESHAQIQARLEQRRAKLAEENGESGENGDNLMEDAPPIIYDAHNEEAKETEAVSEQMEVDPLDAFMAGLQPEQANGSTPQGQTMFADDNEPDMDAVENEDLLAFAASKKKKKDVPVIDHSRVAYEPFRKKFYTEPADIAALTPEEVADLRLELDGIKVKPSDAPRPVTKWAQMGLLQQTMDVFNQLNYTKPTSIQSQAIPIAESGLDMIGIAKTGSGKTLAFGIPIIRHILDQRALKGGDGPIVLILAPTRELSVQIVNELKPFLKASNLKIACAYGGAPISDQIATIKRGGLHVLCATPGRLIDLMQSNSGRVLSLKRITYVVLDEADRMFDMGFEPQVMKIMASTRPDRQTVLFSATFPKNMAALAKKVLNNPCEVIIGGRSVVAPEIDQMIKVVPPGPEKKFEQLLLQLGVHLVDDDTAQALVFVERQETAEDLLAKLLAKRYPCNTIHGGKDQQDRTDAINDFKSGAIPVLIATSVAARGLDIAKLRLVFNYDCPTHLEDYVHRCGRTGRAGNKGTAVTLIENPGQERYAVHLIKALKQSGQDVPNELKDMAEEFGKKVQAGTEKWFDPGFGGKGLDKLDAARALEKKQQKRAHRIEGDAEESDDEPAIPVVAKASDTATTTAAAAPTVGTPTAEPDEPGYMKLLRKGISVTKTERPSPGASRPMTAIEKAKAAASKVDGRLSKKGMIHHGQPIDNKGPDAGAYHSTIEINDFPQKARWAVTNRTNVAKILDQTGTSITTKGTYYPPGKSPGEGELPKLYILVEGDTENVVTMAMMELMRLLREGTIAASEAPTRGPTGRYSVV